MEIVVGAMASGGGCVARSTSGRVMFVRHTLPGERVVAEVTSANASFLRADAVEVIEGSADRVQPPCPHAGPGRCGGCDWQHASLSAQRVLKAALVAEQLQRLARIEMPVEVEEVDGAADGLGWRTRVRFGIDGEGRAGLHRHRSTSIEPIEHCRIASPEVTRAGVGALPWVGVRQVEVTAAPGGTAPTVSVDSLRSRRPELPAIGAGLLVDGRVVRQPTKVRFDVLGHRFEVSAGVFWQVHAGAAAALATAVLEGLEPRPGERAVDLYAGAGLFAVSLALRVGSSGSVMAIERSGRACADASKNTKRFPQVSIVHSDVSATLIAGGLGTPDIVVLDPAREGAGGEVMAALVSLDPAPRRVAYVACDPASFARDLSTALQAGWTVASLRAFDIFPMTEHVELVCILVPPADGGVGPR